MALFFQWTLNEIWSLWFPHSVLLLGPTTPLSLNSASIWYVSGKNIDIVLKKSALHHISCHESWELLNDGQTNWFKSGIDHTIITSVIGNFRGRNSRFFPQITFRLRFSTSAFITWLLGCFFGLITPPPWRIRRNRRVRYFVLLNIQHCLVHGNSVVQVQYC